MYRVALCEDEKVFSEHERRVCRDILERLGIDHDITVFGSGADFLKAFAEGRRYDLILLDILMDGLNGVELGRKIREADEEAAIVFVTSDSGFALDGYDVGALHYLMKPLDPAVLERLIKADYSKRFENIFFIFETDTGKRRTAIRDILFLEAEARRVKVTLTEETVYCPGTLSDLLSELPREGEQFVRCYRTIAVNIGNVRELKKQSALLTNGEEVPVSRGYAGDLRNAFLRQQLRES